MRLIPLLFAFLFSVCSIQFGVAQQSGAQQSNEFIPEGIASLQQSASSKNEFTFDHSMLVLASKLEPGNDDLRRVIAGLSGLSVRNYHFQRASQYGAAQYGATQYDPSALNSVSEEYRAAGWKQLMNKHQKNGDAGMTDLWVRFENNAISNVAILLASANEVSFVEVSGSISPMDISRLGGHFGIPKIEGGVVVPNPSTH